MITSKRCCWAMGLCFLGVMQGQPSHKMVKLPSGWTRHINRQGRDQIEFELLDTKGYHRVRVFITKPSNQITLFDPEREATYILPRFSIKIEEAALERFLAVAKLLDNTTGKVVLQTKPIEITTELDGSEMRFYLEAMEECKRMANDRFLGWDVPGEDWNINV